jgi:hypothetical protein
LEVLIIEDLLRNVLEVLILGDLLAALLILIDFKSCIISDLIKNEDLMEVLILEGLGRAMRRDRAGATGRGEGSVGAELLRGRAAWK